MSFLKFIPLLILAGAIGAWAQQSADQVINSWFHLTGIAATIVKLALGGGIVGGFLLKGVKPLQDARNIINTLSILIEKLKVKNNLDAEEKQDVNNALDAVMAAMADMKLLKDKIPLIQSLKMKLDALPSENVGYAPAVSAPTTPYPAPVVPSIPVTQPLAVEPKDPAASNNGTIG
jgi:FtsZ-binding cell division protein ZapB